MHPVRVNRHYLTVHAHWACGLLALVTFTIAACQDTGGKRAIPTCAQAVTKTDPAVLIEAFRAARLRGHGAGGCLTELALMNYDDPYCDDDSLSRSPGPRVLYRCGVHKVVRVTKGSGTRPPFVELDVALSGTGTAGTLELYENVTIRTGVPAGSTKRVAQVITAVDNS